MIFLIGIFFREISLSALSMETDMTEKDICDSGEQQTLNKQTSRGKSPVSVM